MVYVNIQDNRALAETRCFRASERDVIELARRNDVPGLLQAFKQPLTDWEVREVIVAALGNICRDGQPGKDYQQAEMVAALNSIIAQCKTLPLKESDGTYKDDCIER